MANLVEFFIDKTHEMGRHGLMAALQYVDGVAGRLDGVEYEHDSRPFYWQPSPEAKQLGLKVTRPYTDIAYW